MRHQQDILAARAKVDFLTVLAQGPRFTVSVDYIWKFLNRLGNKCNYGKSCNVTESCGPVLHRPKSFTCIIFCFPNVVQKFLLQAPNTDYGQDSCHS